MARIFVSYRRKETAGHAGRLFDRLRDHFGSDSVFRDVDRLKAGDDFVEALARAVDSADVFILVIGRDWLDVRNQRGERRLDDPTDFIRLELETALRRKILVLPVLVEGATMVDAQDLPEPLRPLARRQAIELSEHRWDFDVQELLRRIDEVVRPKRPLWTRGAVRAAAALLLLAVGVLAGWRWGPWQPSVDNVLKESVSGRASEPGPAPRPPEPAQASPGEQVPRRETVNAGLSTGAANPPTPPGRAADPATSRESKIASDPVTPPSKTSPAASDPATRPPGSEPRRVRVPSVEGQPVRSATTTIANLGLRAKTEWVSSGRYPGSTISGQKPPPDSLVERGTEVFLSVEMPLQVNEHSAGRIFVPLTRTINLDRDDSGSDVGFDRTAGAGFYLHFPSGAQGWLFGAQTTGPLDPVRCSAITLSTSRVLLEEPVRNKLVCVRTTRGRMAMIQLYSLTTEPTELLLRYSTIDRALTTDGGPTRPREERVVVPEPTRRSSVEPRPAVSPTAILPPPSQIEPRCRSAIRMPSPAPGFIFSWQPVDGASSYTVEIDCRGCSGVGRTWYSEAGRPWHIRTGLGQRSPIYSLGAGPLGELLNEAAGHPLRWRVWGVTEAGREGAKSDWCDFFFSGRSSSGRSPMTRSPIARSSS